MNTTNNESPVVLPPVIPTGGTIDELLAYMIRLDGDDLIVAPDVVPVIKAHNKIIPAANRALDEHEVAECANYLAGADIRGLIAQGKPFDGAHALPLDDNGFPLDERARAELPDPEQTARFRVNIVGSEGLYQPVMTITCRKISARPPTVAQIGLEPAFVDKIFERKIGITIIAGATGQGKSTTLAAMLAYILARSDANENLVTLEHPVEYVYHLIDKPSSFVTQLQVGRDISSFASGIRNALRMGPTTILVGEMRDMVTIDAAVQAALTGHRVLSTIHANDAAAIIPRALRAYPEGEREQAKADLLVAIETLISQRLVPAIHAPRIALREYLQLDRNIRRILQQTKLSELDIVIRELIETHGQSFAQAAREAAAKGLIADDVCEQFIRAQGGES
ncbi:MAG: hypothetical protein D6712_19230 [Chloroflexi bacterium]|nr:MAG: hypothetical protein D6712_19230 [Chloroflexota bacterium]